MAAEVAVADYAVVIWGRGAELGDFKQFADDLVTMELSAFKRAKTLELKSIEFRDDFFDYLNAFDAGHKIKQLHIYSHSIGAALFLGYKHPTVNAERQNFINNLGPRDALPLEVLRTERGAVFTDDLVRAPYDGYRTSLRGKFAADGFIKIWGCNAGRANWAYSDPVDAAGTRWTSDINAAGYVYYWRALNEISMPKPSLSQAFADYFQVQVRGALSGANIEVKRNGKWISSDAYKSQVGHYPGPSQVLRLQPTKGTYNDFAPAP
jgi:hypothetical protein